MSHRHLWYLPLSDLILCVHKEGNYRDYQHVRKYILLLSAWSLSDMTWVFYSNNPSAQKNPHYVWSPSDCKWWIIFYINMSLSLFPIVYHIYQGYICPIKINGRSLNPMLHWGLVYCLKIPFNTQHGTEWIYFLTRFGQLLTFHFDKIAWWLSYVMRLIESYKWIYLCELFSLSLSHPAIITQPIQIRN